MVSTRFCRKLYAWADYTSEGILKLRNATDVIECFYMQISGTNANRKMTIVTLGGAPYADGNFTGQCEAASYTSIPNVLTQPSCATPPSGGATAYVSTTLITLNYQGGGVPDDTAGASSLFMSLFAAAGTAAAAGAAMVF